MNDAASVLGKAINELDRLEKVLKKGRPRIQVKLTDERSLAKATALTWFSSHRERIRSAVEASDLETVDTAYKDLYESSERASSRELYLSKIKALKLRLRQLRSELVSSPDNRTMPTADPPPEFAPLVSDLKMQQILAERWRECFKCLVADAPLAATVMMGGLLEALLLSRINKEHDKQKIFTARHAPKDKAGKSRALSQWTLKDYIDVAHELTWITQSARNVGAVLRDYRNCIHPERQLSHNVHLTAADAGLLWDVCKSIARQIIDSAQPSQRAGRPDLR
jgi:hypothetical protein